ncbi:MAG: valine--tRNA ligase [Phycisphaerales bacterium]|nr:valine--tRNA ligase [Phycisphaerales bacterium]
MPTQELPKQYRPGEHESRIWERWLASGAFHADPSRVLGGQAAPYAILIPPPNVTDRLHLGHALNNTLQDILARRARMQGFETLWMPGTDHAGIATQAVVEKRVYAEEKKRRGDFTRDAFVARIQAFKDEYEAVITGQLQKMGCSCDWERQRFTMDDQCAKAVREAFFRLFRDGLIYRGKRLVNWDPALQTAVADDECFDEEVDSFFYYLRYPLVHKGGEKPQSVDDAVPVTWNELARRGYPGAEHQPGETQAWVTVATTRPETYLGDVAVAINPHDPRAAALRGLHVELPLVGRVIPILEDSYVVLPEAMARTDEEKNDPKAKFATGFLKVTPAHDQNDYEIGQRHKAEIEGAGHAVLINVMAPDASISDNHGWTDVNDAKIFVGLTREDARAKVVAEFKSRGWLEAQRPYRHSIKHSDRTKAVVEPYLSDQWYVRVTDPRLAQAANRALHDKDLAFHPDRYAKTFEQWHENIRDWCISRQLWWGHRIPVWSSSAFFSESLELQLDQWKSESKIDFGIVDRLGGQFATHMSATTSVCVRPGNDDVEKRLVEMGFTQDPDVLDTWFSSALWPLSTLGWPGDTPELAAFNPTSTLCTAREIITLWVSRMVMFNRYLHGEGQGHGPVPFRDVFIHAVIQDGQGQKMSKSLGNGVDPLDIIASHGADAMRFTLCHMTTQTQDVRMPVDLVCPHTDDTFTPKYITTKDGYVVQAPIQESPRDKSKKMVTVYGVASGETKATPDMPLAKNTSAKFDLGRNFANKLWNAARFAMGILANAAGDAPAVIDPRELSLPDRWMLSRLHDAVTSADQALKSFEFSVYAQVVYDILWRDFCDWYLEAIKPSVAADPRQQRVLAAVLDAILRLLHPIMPFVTESIYEQVRSLPRAQIRGLTLREPGRDGLLCTAGWPLCDASLANADAAAEFERVRGLVTAIREVRATQNVHAKRLVTLHVPAARMDALLAHESLVAGLCQLGQVTTQRADGVSATFTFEAAEFGLSNLADAVDAGAEVERLTRQIEDLDKAIKTLGGRLSNESYVAKAPPKLVQETKDQLAKAMAEREAAAAALGRLAPSK